MSIIEKSLFSMVAYILLVIIANSIQCKIQLSKNKELRLKVKNKKKTNLGKSHFSFTLVQIDVIYYCIGTNILDWSWLCIVFLVFLVVFQNSSYAIYYHWYFVQFKFISEHWGQFKSHYFILNDFVKKIFLLSLINSIQVFIMCIIMNSKHFKVSSWT